MNITSLMPRFGKSDDVELTEEELDQADIDAKLERIKFHRSSVRNGPANFKSITTGQYRRTLTREKVGSQRKANLRHRRKWMANRQAVAALRGQLSVVLTPQGHPAALVANAEKQLVAAYGSVDEAAAHYAAVMAEAR